VCAECVWVMGWASWCGCVFFCNGTANTEIYTEGVVGSVRSVKETAATGYGWTPAPVPVRQAAKPKPATKADEESE